MAQNHDRFLVDDVGEVYTPICFTCKYWSGRDPESSEKFKCTAYPHGIPIGIITGKLDHHVNLPGDGGVRYEAV